MSDAPPLGFRGTLLYVARRPLPTPWGDLVAHLCLECATRRWVLAVTAGDVGGRAPLIARLHSSCVTSESWGSRDCDCAEQLDAALAAIAGAGRGVVFYLLQEGRGAGFLAKARDRMLVQASGNRLTTFDAYREMGLAADQRRYDDVAPLCALLGIGAPLLLLTNNPEKAAALARHGIALAGTRPLRHAVSPFNAHYLTAKARSGHTLGAAAGEVPAAPPVAVTSFAPHALDGDPRLVRMAAYWLPIAVAEDGPHWFRLDAYLDVGAQRERVVLSYGDPAARPALVRVHRETLLDRFPQRDGGGRARWLATVRAFVDHGAGCALLTLADGSADAGVAACGTGADAGVAPAVAARLLAAHLGAPGAALLADGRDGAAADAALAAALGGYGVRVAAPRAGAPEGG